MPVNGPASLNCRHQLVGAMPVKGPAALNGRHQLVRAMPVKGPAATLAAGPHVWLLSTAYFTSGFHWVSTSPSRYDSEIVMSAR